jgi:hypothetical protein
VDESQFNPDGLGFGLGADGDEVWLFSANAAGELTGYFHGHRFGAADNGVSFGRQVTSDGREHFVAQTTPTLGLANAGPRVGPVVLTEIMYHPPDLPDGSDNRAEEYLGLLNTAATAVPLFHPDHPAATWELRGGIAFDFPTNQTLAGSEVIVVVNFDPTDTAAAAAFRMRYGLDPGLRLFGPYAGKLNNDGDRLALQKPSLLNSGLLVPVLVDEVEYGDRAPWPEGADGSGLSLQRLNPSAYGNEPANWIAAPPSNGRRLVPALAIQAEPLALVFEWEDSPLAWELEEATGLTSPMVWRPSGTPPILTDGVWRATAPLPTATSTFFRLNSR